MEKILKSPLFLILALAALTRLFFLSKLPPALNWDEVSMGYSAYSILETGKDEWGESFPLAFRSYGEYKSPVYIYLLVPFIKLFGLNAWGVRLPAALAGVAAVYLSYLIGKTIYSKKVGLWAAFFLTISPWHLMLSRPAFEAGVSLTLVLAGIYFFLKYLNKPYFRYTIYSALFFGLAPHTYNSAKLVVPLLIIYLIFRSFRKANRAHLLIFLTILAVFAAPILSGIVTGESQRRYQQVGVTTDLEALTTWNRYRLTFPLPPPVNRLLFNKATFFLVETATNYLAYFSPNFLLTPGGPRPQHNIPYHGVLYLAELILIFFSFRALRKYAHPYRYLPLVLILLGFLPAAITKDQFHVLRSILTLPGWQLLAAVGLSYLASQPSLKQLLRTTYRLLYLQGAIFLALYFLWYPKAFARDWQYGYRQAIDYVLEHCHDYQHIVFTKAYGEPHVFVAFYTKLDPRLFQAESSSLLRYQDLDLPWLDQLDIYTLGDYEFRDLDWEGSGENPQILFVGKGDDFWNETVPLETIYFPDGTVAFHLVKGR